MKPSENHSTLAQRVDALLPQTQCQQCGYAGCQPYAEAIASGAALINRCPPGGDEVIADLAALMQCKPLALDTSRGVTKKPSVALIEETWCIGCALCIQACPVDAIIGAAKRMHTVIADECTGCELCIPPCPVDCIQMVAVSRPVDQDSRETRAARAAHAKARYVARGKRLGESQSLDRPAEKVMEPGHRKKHAAVARALERARLKINK